MIKARRGGSSTSAKTTTSRGDDNNNNNSNNNNNNHDDDDDGHGKLSALKRVAVCLSQAPVAFVFLIAGWTVAVILADGGTSTAPNSVQQRAKTYEPFQDNHKAVLLNTDVRRRRSELAVVPPSYQRANNDAETTTIDEGNSDSAVVMHNRDESAYPPQDGGTVDAVPSGRMKMMMMKGRQSRGPLPPPSAGTPLNPDPRLARFNVTRGWVNVTNLRSHVRPVAFPRRTTTLPCLPPDPKWRNARTTMAPTTTGLIYQRLTKTASSTALGVHLRISRSLADRLGHNFAICRVRFGHARTWNSYAHLNRTRSAIWTIVREPTKRLVSEFYHFFVSRGLVDGGDVENLRRVIGRRFNRFSNTYMRKLNDVRYPADIVFTADHVQHVLQFYDFIGITERMDESLVALAMLWDLPLGDVLYLSAKQQGGFDGGGGGCHYLQKSNVTEDMQRYLDSAHVQRMVQFDRVLYEAANASLDRTIDETLGRPAFEANLQRYRQATQLIQERCLAETTFPCSGGGSDVDGTPHPYKQTDCLYVDSGCGYVCLDNVATELGLWDKPLEYRFPRAFGMGRSTRQRIKAFREQERGNRESEEEEENDSGDGESEEDEEASGTAENQADGEVSGMDNEDDVSETETGDDATQAEDSSNAAEQVDTQEQYDEATEADQ